ncbi:MAG: hypothetical protein OCC45_07530 [Desulfotalea sp.]
MAEITPLQPPKNINNNLPRAASQATVSNSGSDTVKAEVIKSLGNNNYLVKVTGKEIAIHSKTPLQNGQKISLIINSSPQNKEIFISKIHPLPTATPQQITTTNPTNIITQGIGSTSSSINIGTILQLLPANIASQLQPANLSMLSQFATLANENNNNDLARLLKLQLNKLGLNHEQQIAKNEGKTENLKNSLLEILSLIGTKHESSKLEEATRNALKNIEFYQAVNLTKDETESNIFPLLFTFLENGFIKIFENQDEQEGSEGSIKFSLYLELSNLGNIQIDFSGSSTGAYILFFTDSEQEANFIRPMIDELQNDLSKRHKIRGIRVAAGASSPTKEILETCRPKHQSMLNTKA